ncbi:MAG: hypothetical protein EOM12_12685 [Verrucomicrobiae bacterium]|nr:hypothetical protein [Verrucomicrobiae bacterium]
MKHEEFILKVLSEAENNALPDQMGPQYTLDELGICKDLIDDGVMDGDPVENEQGRICTIIHPRITLKGRERLRQASEETPIKKHGLKLLMWILSVVGVLLVAWLINTWGLN